MSASPHKARYKELSETTAPAPDWKALAAGAWDALSWKEAAADYRKARDHTGGKPQPPNPQLVALLHPKISLEQAQRRLFEHRRDGGKHWRGADVRAARWH
jgi:hypothetical protein